MGKVLSIQIGGPEICRIQINPDMIASTFYSVHTPMVRWRAEMGHSPETWMQACLAVKMNSLTQTI